MLLFHGSCEYTRKLEVLDDFGLFDGVFCSVDESAALIHGGFVYCIEIDDDRIARSNDLDNEFGLSELRDLTNYDGLDKEDQETLYNAVIYNNIDWDDLPHILDKDAGDPPWVYQRLRGKVAKSLGFEAVEMVDDEYETSYLVLPGNILNRR